MATSSNHNGWRRDRDNSRLDVVVGGTEVGYFDDATADLTLNTNGLTVTAGGVTVTAGGATITAGDLTVTAGNNVVTAGDLRVTAGNGRYGPVNAFATTEPTQAVVYDAGTAPVGAVTESSGVFASTTVLRKIIADGTASNVG